LNMMNRTGWIVLILVCLAISCSSKRSEKDSAQAIAETNDLPPLPVRLSDGNTIQTKDLKGKTILVLFQPDCDHCQNEARQIQENLASFKEYRLYFISSSPIAEIEKFASDYQLAGYDNVAFGWTPTEAVINTLGPIQAPSVYIYSEKGKLVKAINGEVDISVILKYI
jgi:peroxiredoxin